MKYGRKLHKKTDHETSADKTACRLAKLMELTNKSQWRKIFDTETQGRDEKYCAHVREFTTKRLKEMKLL